MMFSKIVTTSRTSSDYLEMFQLQKSSLPRDILSIADGFSSFQAENKHLKIISIDPIYRQSPIEMEKIFLQSYQEIQDRIRNGELNYNQEKYPTLEILLKNRQHSFQIFLTDFIRKREVSYLSEALPSLSFSSKSFDLCLCSHFLFIYDEFFDENFHLQSLLELTRVSREVRIFPTTNFKEVHPTFYHSILKNLQLNNVRYEERYSSYLKQSLSNLLILR